MLRSGLLAAYLLAVLLANPCFAIKWGFEDPAVGTLPGSWTVTRTGEGGGSVWQVAEDTTAPSGKQVLAQISSDAPRPVFNLCVTEEKKYKDVDLSVSFKAIKGDIDQGGGPVWRYRDANNYYICRMNPLESNFRVYKVVDGKRTQLATSDVKVPLNEWHEIRVIHEGNRIRCFLDNVLRLEAEDATFSETGYVGLWTKADAVTHFDDLKIE
jgi:hypothetical protein